MPTELPPTRGAEGMLPRNVKIVSIGSNQSSIDFMDGLTLLFIGLKLTGHLDDWNWVEVLAPLWGPFMVVWFSKLIVTTFFSSDDED